MKTELFYLTLVTAFTGLLWLPYILDRIAVRGVSNAAIATASMVYFWARVVHALSYTFAVPWVRTLSFAAGFFAQAVIAWQLLGR